MFHLHVGNIHWFCFLVVVDVKFFVWNLSITFYDGEYDNTYNVSCHKNSVTDHLNGACLVLQISTFLNKCLDVLPVGWPRFQIL
jgi:hypothetical protein